MNPLTNNHIIRCFCQVSRRYDARRSHIENLLFSNKFCGIIIGYNLTSDYLSPYVVVSILQRHNDKAMYLLQKYD